MALLVAISSRASAKRPTIALRHASWRRIAASDSGLSRTSARIASQRRMPSAAGVGPNQSEDAIHVRIS